VVVVVVAVLLAGCGSRRAGGDPAGGGSDQATSQARRLLASYEMVLAHGADDVVGITSERVSQVGDWESAVGGNNKIAVLTGHVRELPAVATGAGGAVVRWAEGRTVAVRTISAPQAVATLQHEAMRQSCDGCTPVVLEHPSLTRRAVQTTSGNAIVPEWSFAVRRSGVRVTVVAVDASALVPALPQVTSPAGPFLAAESAHATGPRTLALRFVGAPGAGRVACGADYTATAVESQHAVAVLVHVFPHHGSVGGGCSAVGYSRTATVHLASPLAGRAVLDVVRGQSVPLK